jgi:thiol-disulfide isomerase/thioredoxin
MAPGASPRLRGQQHAPPNERRAAPQILVDFYATWCGPCVLMSKELSKLSQSMGEEVAPRNQIRAQRSAARELPRYPYGAALLSEHPRHASCHFSWSLAPGCPAREGLTRRTRGQVAVFKVNTEKYPAISSRYEARARPARLLTVSNKQP